MQGTALHNGYFHKRQIVYILFAFSYFSFPPFFSLELEIMAGTPTGAMQMGNTP